MVVQNMAFTMIYGDRADIDELVEIVLWDDKFGKSLKLSGEEIRFGIDAIKGTLRNPVLFTVTNPETIVNGVDYSGMFKVYPNPFSDRAFIRYSLPAETTVSIIITNSLGEEIKRIAHTKQAAGYYEYIFEAHNLPTGMYYCTFKTDKFVETQKIILFDHK
jgi:hypothetical protein